MLSSGIGMVAREFECILCQRHFSRMTADATLTAEMICDICLAELSQLGADRLTEQVSELLGNRGIQDEELEKRIVSIIQGHNL
jgi:hypothetical protein